MSEARDSGIKLFGRTIAPPESRATGQFADGPDPTTKGKAGEDTKEVSKETSNAKGEISTSDRSQEPVQTEQDASASMNGSDEGGCQVLKKDGEAGGPKSEKEPNEVDGSAQQKVLKKPDKILPCPRCKSLDTKFCYYNNYNVNQPRHFCKNCQRYWTAGGTMRNVPVGAGRRKNKHSASHYRHMLAASEAILSPHLQVDQSNPVRDQVVTCALSSGSTGPLKSNNTVLKLSDEAYHCDPLNSVLNLGGKRKNAERGASLFVENGEEPSCSSPLTSVNGVENKLPGSANCMEQKGMQSSNGPPSMHHLHCYAPPWTYPWLSGWKNVPSLASGQCSSDLIFGQDEANAKAVTWNPPLMMAAPPFCAPALAFPFIPASVPNSFWGCMSGWSNGMWNVPWIGSANGVSSSSFASNGRCSGNSSAVLGKHSRDTSEPVEEKTEKSLWVPKTLRIDDPDEAAKSSIWATLGIIPDPNEPVKKARIFSGFQPINEVVDHHPEGAQVLHVNPAALSRSQTFQEST